MAIVGKRTELNTKGPILGGFVPKEININAPEEGKGVIISASSVQARSANGEIKTESIFLVTYIYDIYVYNTYVHIFIPQV